jgi:flagellar biosynthesis protein FlhF
VYSGKTQYGPQGKETRHSAGESGEESGAFFQTATYSPKRIADGGRTSLLKGSNFAKPSPVPVEDSDNAEPLFKGKVITDVHKTLIDKGVDADLARKLLVAACDSLSSGQRRSRASILKSVAGTALTLLPEEKSREGLPGKKVVAFVGPAGVGKTTSIAKLAAHLAVNKKKKIVLITMDGYRIGAIDQLRTYAGFMGIPFRFVSQVPELVQTIEENRHRDYVLIDTAGRNPRDNGTLKHFADFLRNSKDIERHLVLNVTTNSRDMHASMEQFESCGPDHLLFTRLDETSAPGPLLNEIIRTQKSFSYYSDGQKVPEDLHVATGEQIVDMVINRNDIASKE